MGKALTQHTQLKSFSPSTCNFLLFLVVFGARQDSYEELGHLEAILV
jgi:hypothetical protein